METTHQQKTKYILAGGISGVISAIIVCPLDVVKVRLQNQTTIPSPGTFETLLKIARQEGYKGLFSGLNPTILSYLLDRSIWFTCYENLKLIQIKLFKFEKSSPLLHSSSALFSSLVCTGALTPLWVIRTRMMTQNTQPGYFYKSIRHGLVDIIRKEGVVSLYKGLLPSLVGITHPLIQFPVYESLKINISKYENSYDFNDARPKVSDQGIFVASILSKFVATLITYPHEVVRTRMQTQLQTRNDGQYKGVVETSRLVFNEGVKGWYRGLTTNLIRTIPATSVSMYVYEILVSTE